MRFHPKRLLAPFAALLLAAPFGLAADSPQHPIRLLVLTGGHPYDEDEFWAMFDSMEGIEYRNFLLQDHSEIFEDLSGWQYDVVLFYNMTQEISDHRLANLFQLTEWGVGLVPLHHGTLSWPGRMEIRDIFGVEFPHAGPFGFHLNQRFTYEVIDRDHPITYGMEDWEAIDETYTNYYGAGHPGNRVLITHSNDPGDPELAWVRHHGNSRIANLQGGHDRLMFENPDFIDLIHRSVLWTAGRKPLEVGGEGLADTTIFRSTFEIPAAVDGIRGWAEGRSRLWLTRAEELLREYEGIAPDKHAQLTAGIAGVALDADAAREARSWALRTIGASGNAADLESVATLLGDEVVGDMAIFALEQSPLDEGRAHLRAAFRGGDQGLRIALANSLGRSADAQATPILAEALAGSDGDLAVAAARALGRIGGPEARAALVEARGRVAAADSSLLTWAEGASDNDAVAVYEMVMSDAEDFGVRLAALRGLLGVASDADALWRDSIASQDARVRAAAIESLPRVRGDGLRAAVEDALGVLPASEQARLLHRLTASADAAPLGKVADLLASDDPEVAAAAAAVLGRLGDADAARAVVARLGAAADDEQERLVASLASMPDRGVDALVATALSDADSALAARLLSVLGQRMAFEQLPVATRHLSHEDQGVRVAAFEALGALASLDELPALADALAAAQAAPERRAATRALSMVVERAMEPEAALAVLADRVRPGGGAPARDIITVIATLPGDGPVDFLAGILADEDSEFRADAARALGAWRNPAPAQALLDAAAATEGTLQLLAVRGYLSVILTDRSAGPADLLEAAERARPFLGANAEVDRQFLAVVGRAPTRGSLAVAQEFLGDPNLQPAAVAALRQLSEQLIGDYPAEVAGALESLIESDLPDDLRAQAAEALEEARALAGRLLANWSFVDGLQGWRESNQIEMEAVEGRLVMTSLGNDPFTEVDVDIEEQPILLRFRARYDNPGAIQFFLQTDRASMGEEGTILTFMPDRTTDGWRDHEMLFTPPGRLQVFRMDPAVRPDEVVEVERIQLLRP